MWCRNPLIFFPSSAASDASYSIRTLKLACSWLKVISSSNLCCCHRRSRHTLFSRIIIIVVVAVLKSIISILLNEHWGKYSRRAKLKTDRGTQEHERREYRCCICYESILDLLEVQRRRERERERERGRKKGKSAGFVLFFVSRTRKQKDNGW